MTEIEDTPETAVSPFRRYFQLDEAVSLLGEIRMDLRKAHREMATLRDNVILSKRLIEAKQQSGRKPTDAEMNLLQAKFEAFADAEECWVHHFAEQGIILRDLETGLMDFPYHADSTNEDYFLCWRLPEDGIFYFHGLSEGYRGRHPITLLPE